MTLTLNGERREVLDGLTVAALVGQLGIRGRVAVELNGEVLRQAQHPETTLRDGDTLEVVTFVGGGA
ncbi:MAG TPA: sulfur carrier protein ThiS [Myxococcaceae bacterium]